MGCNLLFWQGYHINAEPSGPNDDQGRRMQPIELINVSRWREQCEQVNTELRLIRSLQKCNEYVELPSGDRAIVVDESFVEATIFIEMCSHTDDDKLRNMLLDVIIFKFFLDQCVIRGYAYIYTECSYILDSILSNGSLISYSFFCVDYV